MFGVHKRPGVAEAAAAKAAAASAFNGLYPSEFTARWMYMPHKSDLLPFSFTGREYLIPVYDTPAKRVLLMCARQVEKSTTLGNQMLAYAALRHYFRSLYVSPTETQTTTFSRDKVSTPIKYSEKLQAMKGGSRYEDNVLYKKFVTESDLTFRFAFLHADRCRGLSADLLCLDELQDLLVDVIPIIEEALSHSPYQILRYAGTPKSLDNTINWYWENYSSQNEWVIPCDACNHWNVPDVANVGKTHLICSKCGKQIYAKHDRAQWASMRDEDWHRNPRDGTGKSIAEPFEGYRISQLTVPWVAWSTILDKRGRYGVGRFANEVLGRAYDSSEKLLSKTVLQPLCRPELRLVDAVNFIGRNKTYMGIDWGGYGQTQTSFTVVTIGTYLADKFTFIYAKRYEAAEADSDFMITHIMRTAHQFRVSLIGTDYGGGQEHNRRLIQEFGLRRIVRYQYAGTKLMYFDRSLARYMANRTEVIMAFVNGILNDHFRFPCWEDMQYPFMSDLLSLFREWNSRGTAVNIQRTPGTSDDTAHSMVYAMLTSMINHPRLDILAPIGEERG